MISAAMANVAMVMMQLTNLSVSPLPKAALGLGVGGDVPQGQVSPCGPGLSGHPLAF